MNTIPNFISVTPGLEIAAKKPLWRSEKLWYIQTRNCNLTLSFRVYSQLFPPLHL